MADILKIKSFYEDETIFEDVLGGRVYRVWGWGGGGGQGLIRGLGA